MATAFEDVSALDALSKVYQNIPFEYLLAGHCLIVASWFPHLKDRFMLSYWVGLSAAFGGGIVSSLLLQDPKVAPIALFSHNIIGVTWTVCWWLINYFPFGVVQRLVVFLPFRIVAKSCMNILRAGIIAERVDLTVRMFPGVWAAPLVIGTVAGSGGKLVIDALLSGVGHADGPSELVSPGFPIRSGFGATLAYWFLVHVYGHLTPAEGHALVTTLFLGHGILSDLLGVPLDFTHLPARIAHGLANVPMCGALETVAVPTKGPKAPETPRPARSTPAKPAASSTTSTGTQGGQKKGESKKGK